LWVSTLTSGSTNAVEPCACMMSPLGGRSHDSGSSLSNPWAGLAMSVRGVLCRHRGPRRITADLVGATGHDRDTRARTEARRARGHHAVGVLHGAHTAGGFDPELEPDDRTHEHDVLGRGASWTESGGGLHERGARGLGERARDHLVVTREH